MGYADGINRVVELSNLVDLLNAEFNRQNIRPNNSCNYSPFSFQTNGSRHAIFFCDGNQVVKVWEGVTSLAMNKKTILSEIEKNLTKPVLYYVTAQDIVTKLGKIAQI